MRSTASSATRTRSRAAPACSGLIAIGELAHAVEDVLADARGRGELPAGLADPLLRAGDALRALVNGDALDPEAIPALIAELASELTADGGR